MEVYLIVHNKIIKNTNQWIVYIDNIMHVVDLREENRLYIDNEYVGEIKTRSLMNYEYKFKIGTTECSIVKLVVDKEYHLVVDGKYLNIKRPYMPLSTPLFSTYIFLVLNAIALLVFTVLNYRGVLDLPNKLFYEVITICWFICMSKCVKALSNCPCKIKNNGLNKLFRFTLMILAECLYMGGVITILSLIV